MGELQWTPVIRGEPISPDLRSEYRPVQAAVGKAARGRTSPRPSALGCTRRVNMARDDCVFADAPCTSSQGNGIYGSLF